MKGLLYKEYVMLKPQLKSWLSILVLFIVYTAIFQNVFMLLMMVSLLGLMNCFNSFHYDKLYRCDEYIGAMPVSRMQMVLAKYIFTILLDWLLAAAALLLAAGYTALTGGSFAELLVSVCAVLCVMLFMQLVLIPLIYAIGIDRARYVNMILWIAPWALILLKAKSSGLPSVSEEMILRILLLSPVLLLILCAVSLPLSVYIFRRKDI